MTARGEKPWECTQYQTLNRLAKGDLVIMLKKGFCNQTQRMYRVHAVCLVKRFHRDEKDPQVLLAMLPVKLHANLLETCQQR